jgi:hypothetical protein
MAVIDAAVLLLRANRYSGSGNWLDESGNGYDAVPSGSPTWDGEKFTLNGSTQWFTIADDPGFADYLDAQSFTLVVVCASNDHTTTTPRCLFDNKEADSGTIGFSIYERSNRVDATVRGVSAQKYVNSSDVAALGVQVSYALRKNGTTNTQLLVDGVVRSTSAGAAGNIAVANPTRIGASGASDPAVRWFNGDIYGAALWRSALSDADIATAGSELVRPPPPANPAAVAASSSAIDVSWDDVAGETGYVVERSPDGVGSWTDVSGNLAAGTVTYQDTGLTASTQYFYRVYAFNADGDGDPSAVVNATTDAAPPTPPTPGGGNRMGGDRAIRKPPR